MGIRELIVCVALVPAFRNREEPDDMLYMTDAIPLPSSTETHRAITSLTKKTKKILDERSEVKRERTPLGVGVAPPFGRMSRASCGKEEGNMLIGSLHFKDATGSDSSVVPNWSPDERVQK